MPALKSFTFGNHDSLIAMQKSFFCFNGHHMAFNFKPKRGCWSESEAMTNKMAPWTRSTWILQLYFLILWRNMAKTNFISGFKLFLDAFSNISITGSRVLMVFCSFFKDFDGACGFQCSKFRMCSFQFYEGIWPKRLLFVHLKSFWDTFNTTGKWNKWFSC